METQEELKLGIGTEEAEILKPAKVEIIDVMVQEVGEKKAKKIQCVCKHPDKQEAIAISSVKVERKGQLAFVGLWINKDSKGLIRKDSGLAMLMTHLGATVPMEMKGKVVDTLQDEKGYLAFKGY